MDKKPPRSDRRFAGVAASIEVGGASFPATIANGSVDGLMVRCDTPPLVGARVVVRRAGVAAEGEVVWRRGRRCGVRCDGPLDLDALFADLPTAPGDLILDKADRARSRIGWPARSR